jgi:hypothetical protein
MQKLIEAAKENECSDVVLLIVDDINAPRQIGATHAVSRFEPRSFARLRMTPGGGWTTYVDGLFQVCFNHNSMHRPRALVTEHNNVLLSRAKDLATSPRITQPIIGATHLCMPP